MNPENRRAAALDPDVLRTNGPLILLCTAAFLAPLIGGTVSVEAMPLEPGYAPMMRAIFGGAELPTLSHFVLALLAGSAAAWSLATRRVLQVPMASFGILTLVFFALVAASVVFSSFLFISLPAVAEWCAYGVTLFAAIAIVGRKSGLRALLASLFAGCAVQALLAVWEYFMLTKDPTWRVFGTWQNPNALAGMLLIGFFIGAGFTMLRQKLLASIASGAGTTAIALAVALTQSKGAVLAAGIGLAVLLVLGLAWLLGKRGVALGAFLRVGACLLALIVVLAAMRMRSGGDATPSPLARVTEASASQEQSSGFRMLLWRGAIRLVREKPLGWGIGSYRYESGRPGLTTQTHFAHNSYLQLGAESGAAAPLVLVALGVVWLGLALRGAGTQSSDILAIKVGVVSAVVAAAVHSAFDSDLYYFGSGFAFFMLLGAGLQLNVDGVTPESIQRSPRASAFALSLAIPFALLYFGAIEATKAHFKWHAARGETQAAQEGARSLNLAAGPDGDGWYLSGLVETDPLRRLMALKRAAELMPSTRNIRALAREQMQQGDKVASATTLNSALHRDPHNLFTLKLLLDLYLADENPDMAAKIAQRLIDVEETPVFKVRSLPELVPTETFFARKYLAESAKTAQDRIGLLQPAFEGMLEYAVRTVPNVAGAVREGMEQGFAGESFDDAWLKLEMGNQIAAMLAQALRETNRDDEAADVERRSKELHDALGALSVAKAEAPRPTG